MDVSVLILTLNEEANLANCLKSLAWCDDVVVLDSYSNDQTESIAKEYGARFIQRKFDDYARQRNYGLNEIDYRHSWLLIIDADEICPPELIKEIETAIHNCDKDTSLFRVRRKDHFMGRWIRHSSGYPTWAGRLARIGKVQVTRAINEEYHTDGRIGILSEHLLHYSFNKGFHAWFEKHNRYSTMEAEKIVENTSRKIRIRELFHSDPLIRRKTTKKLFYLLPGRPILMFTALYFVRLGFLDGAPGLTFCLLRSFYEFMINCKVKELKRRQQGLAL